MIAAPGVDAPVALRTRLADLYCAYTDTLDDGALEAWPDFFTEDCLYKVIPRENFEQRLPIALIYCESRDMLIDWVTAIRETALYVPRLMRHLVSNIRLREIAADGARLTASFALLQTMIDRPQNFSCAVNTTIGSSTTVSDCFLPSGSASMIRQSCRPRSSIRFSRRRTGHRLLRVSTTRLAKYRVIGDEPATRRRYIGMINEEEIPDGRQYPHRA
jgi:3-phenylpropionate/cinnamic acid dioxygenase small subunit